MRFREVRLGATFLFLSFVVPWLAAALYPHMNIVFGVVLIVEAAAITFWCALIGSLFLICIPDA